MANTLEIERKFLLREKPALGSFEGIAIRQGYLMTTDGRALRIRQKADRFLLTLKIAHEGISRHEFEYEVPASDGAVMLEQLCLRPPVEKTRYEIPAGQHVWEVDIFEGANKGLMMAEVELRDPDEAFTQPDWIGPEVSHDPRFSNAALYETPFGMWGQSYEALLAAHQKVLAARQA